MKNQTVFKALLAILFLTIINITIYSQQNDFRKRVGVVSIKVTDLSLNEKQAAKLLRNALIELDTFEVIDEYDMQDLLSKNKKNTKDCYSVNCLSMLGKDINADFMLTGSVEKLLDKIIVSLRLIDVNDRRISKRKLLEFVYIEQRLKDMLKITLKELMNKKVDPVLRKALTKENQYESNINIPDIEKLSLSGPRIGLNVLTGEEAEIYKDLEKNGGFDGRPVLFQFGYQFEVSYLNAGKLQALFEIIPVISGVDQGRIIPSLTLLNGVRMNTNGFEFAVGPIFILTKKAEGFIDSEGNWKLKSEINQENGIYKKRLDSRGDPYLDTGLVFALGKSFKSGKVNFPVNIFVVLKKKDIQFGLSLGFNASDSRKK